MHKSDITYPDAIVYAEERDGHRVYRLCEQACRMLADVSLAPIEKIRDMVLKRSWWVWPGFAITTGKDADHIIIYMSNVYFHRRHFGNHPLLWLRQLSHECVHINHRAAFKSQWRYLWSFTWDYIRHFGHDTPREREADAAMDRFDRINKSRYFAYGSLRRNRRVNERGTEIVNGGNTEG